MSIQPSATGQVENKLKFELGKLTKLLQTYQKKLGSKTKGAS